MSRTAAGSFKPSFGIASNDDIQNLWLTMIAVASRTADGGWHVAITEGIISVSGRNGEDDNIWDA